MWHLEQTDITGSVFVCLFLFFVVYPMKGKGIKEVRGFAEDKVCSLGLLCLKNKKILGWWCLSNLTICNHLATDDHMVIFGQEMLWKPVLPKSVILQLQLHMP